DWPRTISARADAADYRRTRRADGRQRAPHRDATSNHNVPCPFALPLCARSRAGAGGEALMPYRLRVLGLLFLLIFVMYLDRLCISVAGTRIQQDLHLTPRALVLRRPSPRSSSSRPDP